MRVIIQFLSVFIFIHHACASELKHDDGASFKSRNPAANIEHDVRLFYSQVWNQSFRYLEQIGFALHQGQYSYTDTQRKILKEWIGILDDSIHELSRYKLLTPSSKETFKEEIEDITGHYNKIFLNLCATNKFLCFAPYLSLSTFAEAAEIFSKGASQYLNFYEKTKFFCLSSPDDYSQNAHLPILIQELPIPINSEVLSLIDDKTFLETLPVLNRKFNLYSNDEKIWQKRFEKKTGSSNLPAQFLTYKTACINSLEKSVFEERIRKNEHFFPKEHSGNLNLEHIQQYAEQINSSITAINGNKSPILDSDVDFLIDHLKINDKRILN